MFTNIATYQFAPLRDLKPIRIKLQDQCRDWNLKGTILLSTEGINLFVAGCAQSIGRLLAELRKIPQLENLSPKFSQSQEQPFTRMLIRIKKEIIAFGVDTIVPYQHTSPRISPRELQRWIEEGREFTLLDTRNDYEIKLGTFENALPAGIKHFRDFPQAVAKLPDLLRTKPIVTFCTGGIRCEKAAPYLESQGFEKVFQLDGGILKYFEEVGNAHYRGNCFVFDQRVGVDPCLQETSDAQCFACLTPLSPEDQNDERYEKGRSCRYCFKSNEERMKETLQARHAALAKLMTPLPGSTPYRQERPFKIPATYAGRPLIEFLSGVLRHVSEEAWLKEFAQNLILGPLRLPVPPSNLVLAGERYYHLSPSLSEPEVNVAIRIHYEDEAIIILEKPAPLPIHPCGRFNRNTLQYVLNSLYSPEKPRPAHRLDANTTGVLLITRTKHFAGIVQPQFARGEVKKRYLARVHGLPPDDRFSCDLALSEETNEVGSRFAHESGLSARTEFTVLRRFADGTALLEARPITGRTNQIRIHLWELGFPIVGEQLYLPKRRLGKVQTGAVEDAPLCLHAAGISFQHPVTKKRMAFTSASVDWARDGEWQPYFGRTAALALVRASNVPNNDFFPFAASNTEENRNTESEPKANICIDS